MGLLDGTLTNQRKAFLSDLQKLADEQRAKLAVELREISMSTVSELDRTLKTNMQIADQKLSEQRGSLESQLQRQIGDLSETLANTIVFFVTLVGLGALTWRGYQQIVLYRRPLRSIAYSTGIGIVLLVTFVALANAYVWWNQNQARQRVVDDYTQSYTENFNNIRFDDAVFYANQLHVFDPSDLQATARDAKIRLIRDIFSRPALYRSGEVSDVLGRLSSAQSNFITATGKRDLDLDILLGFIAWQRGADRFSEYMASCALASTLAAYQAKNADEMVVLLPFAEYYLRSYLVNPLPDEVVSALLVEKGLTADQVFTNESVEKGEVGQIQRRYRVAELRDIVDNTKTMLDVLAKKSAFYDHAIINWRSVQAYRAVISGYSEIVRLKALLQEGQPGLNDLIYRRIKAMASKIVLAFEDYEGFLENTEFSDSSAKLNMMRGFWIYYVKAKIIAEDPGSSEYIWPNLQQGIHKRWLENVVKPAASPAVYKLIDLSTQSDLREANRLLENMTFGASAISEERFCRENDCSKLTVAPSRQSASFMATAAGLFGCTTTPEMWWKLENSIACIDDNQAGTPLGTIITRSAPINVRLENDTQVREILLKERFTPAF